MKKGLAAKHVRALLILLMLIIAGLSIVGFVYIRNNLNSYAVSISKLNAEAESGDRNLQALRRLEERFENGDDEIADARALLSDELTYGDRVVDDISRIARETNVMITGYEFNDVAPATGGTAAAAAPAATPQAAAATPLPAGVKKKTVTVSLKSPIQYNDLMRFLTKLESNRLQLHISSLSLTKDKETTVNLGQPLKIELYVKEKVAE